MNAILGAKIRSLRESKGITQEQVADILNCTRQKYARLEKGLIDISYASLATIAQVLMVKMEDITSAVNNKYSLEPMYRDISGSDQTDKFDYINHMIDTFLAHKKLYNSIRQVDRNE
jgi:transcriptional regulator with XRE-family HTH domain